MRIKSLGLALVLGFGLCAGALADEKAVAVDLVSKAAGAVTASKEVGLKAIQDGKYVSGEVYVFAYDLTATMLAHPKNPRLVGKNLMDQPDAEGKLFRKDIIATVNAKGKGWVDYVYKNPVTNAIEAKTTFCQKAVDVVICAGAYK